LVFEGIEHVVGERGQEQAPNQIGGQSSAAAVAQRDVLGIRNRSRTPKLFNVGHLWAHVPFMGLAN
jgi:hypothetical protein